MARTQSAKADKAEKLLKQDPNISGADLARKTGLNITTIYRASWWIKRAAAQKKSAE